MNGLKLLKSLLSIKRPAGNEIARLTQEFEENQTVLKSKFANATTNKMKRTRKSTAMLFH